MTAVRILFAVLFVFAFCRSAGQLFLGASGLQLRRGETLFLEFVSGAAVVSTLVFLLASAHLVYTSLLTVLGTLTIAMAFLRRVPRATRADSGPELPVAWRLLFWGPYLVFACLYLVAAMGPETSPDGTGYHLGLVSRYYLHRGFYPVTTSMFAGLAEGIEMLFLVAFAMGRHSAAAMVHVLFLLTLPMGMVAWARRSGVEKAGILGALLFYLAPVVGKDGTIAYIDVATAAVVFAAFCFLDIWRTESRDRPDSDGALAAAGMLGGFAYACKITASPATAGVILFVVVTAVYRRMPARETLRLTGMAALFATLFAAPWLIKDIVQFHNPFFPLFNHWFPNPYLYPKIEDELRGLMKNVANVGYARIPYEAIIGGKLAGVLGPVFLLSPLALLSLRKQAGRLLLLAFVPMFLPFFSNIGARFLLPSLPFLSLALGLGILELPKAGPTLGFAAVLLHAGFSWPPWMDLWSPGFQWRIDQYDWRVALRVTPEKTFLEDHWRDYKPGLLLERFVPPGDRVFSPAMGQMAYQPRETLGTFESALGRRAFLLFMSAQEKILATTWHREIHFPTVKTSRVRLIARSTHDNDLRIGEMRFALGKNEIARQGAWKLTASANPWEMPYAFDNSPVSFWTSGTNVEPGLWAEVDFGLPVELDRILVSQNEDQRWVTLQPAAMLGGNWTPLHARESDTSEPPRATMRMEVRDELKALGIHWILIPDGAYGANDLSEKSLLWGITQVASVNGFRLWRLD